MNSDTYGIIEMAFSFGVILALAIWQLISVRRSIARDREQAKEALAKLPAEDCLRSQFGLGCGGFGIAVLAFAPRLVDFP
jgi:hypothetical protein